jgi:hypothetical protein
MAFWAGQSIIIFALGCRRVSSYIGTRAMASSSSSISFALLTKQNAETSNALIGHWKDSTLFAGLAEYEGQLTIHRDDEDGIKLQKGIDFAKSKGVIDPDYVPEKYVEIDVLGKTPDSVADEILQTVKSKEGDSKEGSVIVLCGLSGTGKVSRPNSYYGKYWQCGQPLFSPATSLFN